MAQQTINSNSVEPLSGPNTGLGVDFGDTWQAAVTKLNAMFTEIYGGIQNAGGASVRPAGNLKLIPGSIGSSATTTTQTLASYSLPGGSLANTNSEVIVTAWGRTGATGSPSIALNMGGFSGSISAGSHVSSHWVIEGIMTTTGSAVQNDLFSAVIGAIPIVKSGSDTSSDASAISITVTVTDANAVQSSAIIDGFQVEFFN